MEVALVPNPGQPAGHAILDIRLHVVEVKVYSSLSACEDQGGKMTMSAKSYIHKYWGHVEQWWHRLGRTKCWIHHQCRGSIDLEHFGKKPSLGISLVCVNMCHRNSKICPMFGYQHHEKRLFLEVAGSNCHQVLVAIHLRGGSP